MIYVMFGVGEIDDETYNKWYNETPGFRRKAAGRFKIRIDRVRSLCAYRMLSMALERQPEFTYNQYGKPLLSDSGVQFSISHSGDCVAVGMSEDGEIGVDAETLGPMPGIVMRKVFTPNEIAWVNGSDEPDTAFFKLWTLKEAYIKALGVGMSYRLHDVEFTLTGDAVTCSDGSFVCSTHTVNGHQISVCGKVFHELAEIDISDLESVRG